MKSGNYAARPYRISVGGRELQYILRKSSRRTIGISIDSKGTVVVAGPTRIADAVLHEFIVKKTGWIFDKLDEIGQRNSSQIQSEQNYSSGSVLSYRGQLLTLEVIAENGLKKAIVRLEGSTLHAYVRNPQEAEEVREALKGWFVSRFIEVLEERCPYYSGLLGVRPGRITVREQKTRWGSCSSKGNINMNWRLIMAPPDILDYVLIHELCHMKEMNHSKSFWALVGSLCPNYKLHREWLKKNGNSLVI